MTTKKKASLLTMGPISAISQRPGRQHPRFRKFVHARNQQLRCHHKQDHGGDGEKLSQVNLHAAFKEGDAQRHCQPQTQHATNEIQKLLVRKETAARNKTVSAPSRKTMRKTNKKRPAAALWLGDGGKLRQLRFDFVLHALAGAPHPVNHGGDKYRADQHEPALVGVFDDRKAMDHVGSGEAGGNSGGKPRPHVAAPSLAPGLFKIAENDAENQRRFHAFAERNDQ